MVEGHILAIIADVMLGSSCDRWVLLGIFLQLRDLSNAS